MSDIILPEGVQHVRSNFYLVKPEMIKMAPISPINEKINSNQFFNPRRFPINGKHMGEGFELSAMEELLQSIKNQGLMHPIQLWGQNGFENLILIAGERRKRCLDKLIESNADCYCPVSKTIKPAKELYSNIECKIHINIPLQRAWAIASHENGKSKPIGEAASVIAVKKWREMGWSDAEILEVTGMSKTWLRETDSICNLDDETFSCFINKTINRRQTIEFAEIENKDERIEKLHTALKLAQDMYDVSAKRIQNKVEKYKEKKEIETVREKLSTDPKIKEKAKEHLAIIEEKIKKNEEIIHKKPKITTKIMSNVIDQKTNKTLSINKIMKFWKAPVDQYLEMGCDPETGAKRDISVKDASLIVDLCAAIEAGNKDILSILEAHNKGKQ